MSDIEQIRKIIISKNLILNARYLNDDLDMREQIIKLISEHNDKIKCTLISSGISNEFDILNKDIKTELIEKNQILKYWKLNEHPEYFKDITSLIINKTAKLEECVNRGEYHCICGRLKNILDKQFMLPDRYPGVYLPIEEDCARLIEQLVFEIINEIK